MVNWFDAEAELLEKPIQVYVKDYGWKDDNDKPIEHIPVKDLSNKEISILQQDPILESEPGFIGTEVNPKSHMFMILLTHRRIIKGNPSLESTFTFQKMQKWGTSRTTELSKRISQAVEKLRKKLDSSPNPTEGKPSVTPSNIQT